MLFDDKVKVSRNQLGALQYIMSLVPAFKISHKNLGGTGRGLFKNLAPLLKRFGRCCSVEWGDFNRKIITRPVY